MAQSQADIVESFKKTELAEWVNLEGCRKALIVSNCLRFKRDGQLIIRNGLRVVEQSGHLRLTEPRQHDAVLAALEKKMSANVGAMTARKPKSESAQAACSRLEPHAKFCGDEYLRAIVARVVEHETGSGSPVAVRRQIKEEKLAVAGAFDALEKTVWE